ncbi:hypothetical protein [Sporosarcina sp. HYO08]|uniref:hypothetical protein n=1 Tax=Sporosarcina sp. HYO08 TaxID=1759557 RepID=UPI00079C9FB9|nr:hypothetical protein [Sporosarcina sp. HYO08]KXH79822.1 hypothetical protein AU377_10085 [Sporosarcina sp. HYO08]
MDIWTIPLIIVILIITLISVLSVRKGHKAKLLAKGRDGEIPEPIEDHPFTLNPIIWVMLVATMFAFIVIFYYWASSF